MAGHTTGERFRRREGEGILATGLQWLLAQAKLRLAVVVGSAFTLIGAGLALLVMRLIVLDKVLAQDAEHKGRMARIEANAEILSRTVESNTQTLGKLTGDAGTLIRAECLRLSKADQELLQMACPPNLYRGVQR